MNLLSKTNSVIDTVQDTEYKELVSVWESSVKATHDFLHADDFHFYKEQMPTFFESVVLHCIKNEKQITGFIGTHEGNIEMLFVHADFIGMGIGRKLLQYAMEQLNATNVDVNRDNIQAVGFYEKFGFEVTAVSESDGFGKPYPILHMKRKESIHSMQIDERDVLEVEKQLLEAMKKSDIETLDRLLHVDLLFILHTGEVITKEMDLATHRSGNLKLEEIISSIDSMKLNDDHAVVAVTSKIRGRFLTEHFEATFRYMRVWKKTGNELQVIAGSCVVI